MQRLNVRSLKEFDQEQVLAAARAGKRFAVDKTIPIWVKVTGCVVFILGAFLYLWSPIDFIPDAIPVVGTADDSVGFVAITVFAVLKWVKERGLKMAYDHAMTILSQPEESEYVSGRPM